jgi:hypothetical protein
VQERIEQELTLLKARFPKIQYEPNGRWLRVPSFPTGTGWNRATTDVVFQIPVGYPGTSPYGIYVPGGLLFNGQRPNNYTEPAPTQPAFQGSWGIFSWSPEEWRPGATASGGFNLVNWVVGFSQRFQEGV